VAHSVIAKEEVRQVFVAADTENGPDPSRRFLRLQGDGFAHP
jgi:hypothetical protein